MQGMPSNSAAKPTEVGYRPGACDTTPRDPFEGIRQVIRLVARQAAAEWLGANAAFADDDHATDEVSPNE